MNMKNESIPYCSTGYFSKLICDYLAEKPILKPFYNKYPNEESLLAYAKTRSKAFSKTKRERLVQELLQQNRSLKRSTSVDENIQSLSSPHTLTITTGHQLNIFTGPLYFFYKILDVVQLSKKLNEKQTTWHFVPVFWMATEDHDFEEINHFYFRNKKIEWESDQKGAVGRFSTQGLEQLTKELEPLLGRGENGRYLLQLFKEAYEEHNTLSEATRYLINTLFGDLGVVIIDGDSPILKQMFTPIVKSELLEQKSYKTIQQTTEQLLKVGYHEQVHPREINLFYLTENNRLRIEKDTEGYRLVDTDIHFSKTELCSQIEQYPERFSPNALLRSVYQEMILPNVAYIGGGGELAYWFQLKEYFKQVEIPYPIVVLRTSMILLEEKQALKLDKMGVEKEILFKDQPEIEAQWARRLSEFPIDLSVQKTHLEQQFSDLYVLAKETDASFLGAVIAQERKQIKGLEHLEKRLLKAQKRKYAQEISRVTRIKNEIFPKENLQERISNFSEYYLAYGSSLIESLSKETSPLDGAFKIIVL